MRFPAKISAVISFSLLVLSVAKASPMEANVALAMVKKGEVSQESTLIEMTRLYRKRHQSMNLMLRTAPRFQKEILSAYLKYARREILNQTDGSGFVYERLNRFVTFVEAELAANRVESARDLVNEYFGSGIELVSAFVD